MATQPKRHRSFTKKDQKPAEPITFDIYDEVFEAWPRIQGAVILEFAAQMAELSSDDDDENTTSGAAAAGLLLEFFNNALKPDDLVRFKTLIHDPEKIVEAEELADIVGWLMEQYTARNLSE